MEATYDVVLGPMTTTSSQDEWRLHPSRFAALRQAHRESESTSSTWSSFARFRGVTPTNRYYRRNVEMLDGFTEMDALHERLMQPSNHEETLAREEEERAILAKKEKFAIRITNVANLALFVAKVFVSFESRSLAIIASALDSLLDLLSGFILWFTAHSMSKTDQYQYPIGKRRMQPLGIIVFACVMAMLGFQVLVEAARQLAGKDHSVSMRSWGWVVGIMLGVTLVKAVLLVYSLSFKNEIIRAYAKDHFFDVVTNTIGLAAYLLANWLVWWIDPAGAVVLSLYTIHNWGQTVLENVNSLVGRTAPPEFLQKLTYLCWNHHKDILQIDTVRAYTFGSHYFTEVDIVLPANMPLQEAHDIGEALQEKLESLPEIERAFVHLDYEVGHRPEHGGPQGLLRSTSTRATGDDSEATTPATTPNGNGSST